MFFNAPACKSAGVSFQSDLAFTEKQHRHLKHKWADFKVVKSKIIA